MNPKQPRVAIIGAGYWGKNLVRVFHQLGALAVVCDVRPQVLEKVRSEYAIPTSLDVQTILDDPAISAVVIAAPAAQHYQLAKKALLAGKDVFVEKPLALTIEEGRELVTLAHENNRILMVGHILEYHPAVELLKGVVREGELGKIQYIYSSRLNLGKLRTEENILWSFAPHDISVILSLLGEKPSQVASHGGAYVNPHIFDTTLTTLSFPSDVKAHIFVSWLHPFKEQKLTVVGDRGMAVFDDTQTEHKLVLYSHRIDWRDRVPVAHKDSGRTIAVPPEEPLRLECEHFLECLEKRTTPRTSGENGLAVLTVLDRCEHSLREGGQPLALNQPERNYFVHPTAVIDEPCEIGDGARIWHFSHLLPHSVLGKNCNLGQNVVAGPDVVIGNNVKIQNNVSVYTGVELEDDVFCGPSMVFTNVINPRSHIVRKHEYQKTLVKKGASIGANATIVCGITIGRYAFIGAGAVVVRDVPDYALVVGNPARQIGWTCSCGVRLPQAGQEVKCSSCHRWYAVVGKSCVEIDSRRSSVTNLA